ncbi:MAG: hypothetical protein SVV03_06625 [Candidatus Nanohaloarchaea archaeon]|nr:hypothetical protein [Candidatus Nanohaloarchaea archaeon]
MKTAGFPKKLAVVVLVLTVSATASVSAATDFQVNIEEVKKEVKPSDNDSAIFRINIENTGVERTFKTSVNTGTATSPGWYYLDKPLQSIASNRTGTAELRVSPDIGAVAGNRGPEIIVYPLGSPEQQVSQLITFSIIRDSRIAILGLSGIKSKYRPSGHISVRAELKNVIQREIPANEYQLHLELDEKNVTVPIPSMETGQTRTVTGSIDLENHRAGIYDLEATVKTIEGEIHSRKVSRVKIAEKSSLDRDRKVDRGLLTSRTIIEVHNKGNAPAKKVKIEESIPSYIMTFTTFEDGSSRMEEKDGKVLWRIKSLEPGQTAMVSYRTNFWPPILVVLVLLVAGTLAYRYSRRMNVSKQGKVGDGLYSIHLKVENQTGARVERVKLKDFVPGIASLVTEYESSKPEKVQKTSEGTKMVWDIGMMEPGEERIITYKLKPKVKVEDSTRLPSAELEYYRKGEKNMKTSYPLSARFS